MLIAKSSIANSSLDAGGDGVCCKHGKGSYEVSWDGNLLKEGAAFYDSETTPFGLCGDTEPPTESNKSNAPSGVQSSASESKAPSRAQTSTGGNGKSGDSSYKCLPENLIDEGYEVSIEKCDMYENCFNEYINVGDDWFCNESEQCVSAPSCGESNLHSTESSQAKPMVAPSQVSSGSQSTSPTVKTNPQRPTVPVPKPSGLQITPTNMMNDLSTTSPSSSETQTSLPTTFRPPEGPCSSLACYQDDHCRSQFGFCGPGDTYCNDNPIWTKDCPSVSSIPTTVPTTSDLPIDRTAPTTQPSKEIIFTKPAFTKPESDGSISKPARTHSPITNYPTSSAEINQPAGIMVTAVDHSDNPTIDVQSDNPTSVDRSENPTSDGRSDNPSVQTTVVVTNVLATLSPTQIPSLEKDISSGK